MSFIRSIIKSFIMSPYFAFRPSALLTIEIGNNGLSGIGDGSAIMQTTFGAMEEEWIITKEVSRNAADFKVQYVAGSTSHSVLQLCTTHVSTLICLDIALLFTICFCVTLALSVLTWNADDSCVQCR